MWGQREEAGSESIVKVMIKKYHRNSSSINVLEGIIIVGKSLKWNREGNVIYTRLFWTICCVDTCREHDWRCLIKEEHGVRAQDCLWLVSSRSLPLIIAVLDYLNYFHFLYIANSSPLSTLTNRITPRHPTSPFFNTLTCFRLREITA